MIDRYLTELVKAYLREIKLSFLENADM